MANETRSPGPAPAHSPPLAPSRRQVGNTLPLRPAGSGAPRSGPARTARMHHSDRAPPGGRTPPQREPTGPTGSTPGRPVRAPTWVRLQPVDQHLARRPALAVLDGLGDSLTLVAR